jgi:hypothetical protein
MYLSMCQLGIKSSNIINLMLQSVQTRVINNALAKVSRTKQEHRFLVERCQGFACLPGECKLDGSRKLFFESLISTIINNGLSSLK